MKLYPKPVCKIRTTYEYDYLGIPLVIEFVKVKNVPGFSHRVCCFGQPIDWLASDVKPSAKTAKYYYDKHAAKCQQKYRR